MGIFLSPAEPSARNTAVPGSQTAPDQPGTPLRALIFWPKPGGDVEGPHHIVSATCEFHLRLDDLWDAAACHTSVSEA